MAGVQLTKRGTVMTNDDCCAQDHVVAGVKLTKRDTFMGRAEFMQLVYAACSPARPGLTDLADLALPPPTVWKPRQLWTGKQVRTRALAGPYIRIWAWRTAFWPLCPSVYGALLEPS